MVTRGVDPERPRCAGCRARAVAASELLCPNCWRLVPVPAQRFVKQALRAFHTDPTDEAWEVLMVARVKR